MAEEKSRTNARFVVITGLSGSGKSTALKALEDLGFYAVDNLPVQLLAAFVNLPLEYVGEPFKAALVMDVRAPGFVEQFPAVFSELSQSGYSLELLFLDAGNEALIRRFSQTRRHHPLAEKGEQLLAGIERERALLAPIREHANQILDTSRFSVHELRREVTSLYSLLAPPAPLQVNLISFGYKYGLPNEADIVMDVRFLANPFFVEELRPLDGCDPRVVDFIFKQESADVFLKKFKDLLTYLIPRYHKEGKSQITIAVGCTGGRHRSVAVSEWLAKELDSMDQRLTLRHRDIGLE